MCAFIYIKKGKSSLPYKLLMFSVGLLLGKTCICFIHSCSFYRYLSVPVDKLWAQMHTPGQWMFWQSFANYGMRQELQLFVATICWQPHSVISDGKQFLYKMLLWIYRSNQNDLVCAWSLKYHHISLCSDFGTLPRKVFKLPLLNLMLWTTR